MYELTLLLAPLPFMLMWALGGLAPTLRHVRARWQITGIWLATAAVCVGYILFVLLTAKVTYQEVVTGGRQHVLSTLKTTLPMLFSVGFVRALADGWVDAVRVAVQDIRNPAYLLVVALVSACAVWLTGKNDRKDFGRPWRIALIGAVALALGYCPFLLSPSHLGITQRTFLFAAIGAALIFGAALVALSRRSVWTASILAVLLIALGTAQQLYQFREYGALHDRQRTALRTIVEQVQDVPPGKTLLVLDESQQINHTWMLQQLVPSALTYLTGQPVRVAQVCLMPNHVWSNRDAFGREGSCIEGPDSWTFKSDAPFAPGVAPISITVPKSDIVVARIRPDATAPNTPEVARNRAALLQGNSVLARRYRGVLQPDSWPFRILGDDSVLSTHRWDFGRRWSLEQAEPGSGWGEAAWIYRPFQQKSVAWMNRPTASLVFPLAPAATQYELRVRLSESFGGPVTVKINGQVLTSLIVPGGLSIAAIVPPSALKAGMNTLTFEAPVNQVNGFAMQVDRIELQPTKR